MRLTIERIAIAVLLVIIIVFLLKDCSRPSEQREADRKQQYETEVAILQAEKATVQSRQDSLVRRYKEKVRVDSSNLAYRIRKLKPFKPSSPTNVPKL